MPYSPLSSARTLVTTGFSAPRKITPVLSKPWTVKPLTVTLRQRVVQDRRPVVGELDVAVRADAVDRGTTHPAEVRRGIRRGHERRPVPEELDAVGRDLDVLGVRAALHDDRRARRRGVDRGLDRLARMDDHRPGGTGRTGEHDTERTGAGRDENCKEALAHVLRLSS